MLKVFPLIGSSYDFFPNAAFETNVFGAITVPT
jgi:hypothetical protein